MTQVSLAEIEDLEARCNADLDERAAVEKVLRPGIPIEAHRKVLMGGLRSPIDAVRQLLKDEKVE